MLGKKRGKKELLDIRVDDIPLLYAMIKDYGIIEIVDKYIVRHENWKGISPGNLLAFWLSYLLSTSDHRLSSFEKWAEQHILLLSSLYNDGTELICPKDFADDRLEKLLDYLSGEKDWRSIEKEVNANTLSVYSFGESKEPLVIRTDSAPMQSYGGVKGQSGLLQYGYSKHHNKNLAQFKVQMTTLDNCVNHFAQPLCHLTVSGEQADDGLYVPVIQLTQESLRGLKGCERGNLYIGDGKMGSQATRVYVVGSGDYYMCPLSKVQLSLSERLKAIALVKKEDYEQVTKVIVDGNGTEETNLVAIGFERLVSYQVEVDTADGTKMVEWQERQLFVRSVAYSEAQERSLEKKLKRVEEQIKNLTVRKKGKKVLHTLAEVKDAVEQLLDREGLTDLLAVQIDEKVREKEVRAYGGKPKRTEKTSTFELTVSRNEQAIIEHKHLLAWQVYATNAPASLLSFESCVWKYRYQSNIERRFDDLRNKVVKLLPVYLSLDHRIEALVNILLLALKICSTIEYSVAKKLQDKEDSLDQLYDGNPRRKTNKPSTKRMLKAFEGISIAVIFVDKKAQFTIMTKLERVQEKILDLLGIDLQAYTTLADKIQMFCSHNQVTET